MKWYTVVMIVAITINLIATVFREVQYRKPGQSARSRGDCDGTSRRP
jgi:hypothetical protein